MPGPWLSPAHFPRWAVPSPLQKSPLIREAHGALHTCTGWGHTGVTVPCTSRSHSCYSATVSSTRNRCPLHCWSTAAHPESPALPLQAAAHPQGRAGPLFQGPGSLRGHRGQGLVERLHWQPEGLGAHVPWTPGWCDSRGGRTWGLPPVGRAVQRL